MGKPRVVLDTNTLISSIFWKGNEAKLVELAEKGAIDIYISSAITEELKRILTYPKFNLTSQEINLIAGYLLTVTRTIEPKTIVHLIKEDSADNRILECAIEAKASYIISGDKHLLKLKKYKGINIIKTEELLKTLNTL